MPSLSLSLSVYRYVGDNRVQACAIRFAELLMGYGVVGTDIVASLEELYEAERDNDDNISLSSYTSLDRLDERVPMMALKTPLACSSKGEIGCIMEVCSCPCSHLPSDV
eukprot:TRINITY_DN3324_c0_g1_i3.p1 TRINITY_DN3324_c0_g1~~TRINITY_DN3324_c0_g1_i3.p1  ORF type:complete len:109 (+),score=15.14 TRINITY_DN3324_c0_g1_i3:227-553(+)